MTLWDRIGSGAPVLLDGAMGTELERRGAPVARKGWAVAALANQPDLVRAIHADYVRAGAVLHTTQTFSAARHALEAAGLGERFAELNRTAVALCREAIAAEGNGTPQWIAGSVSTYAEGSNRGNLPPRDRLAAEFAEQSALLAECGVDLIALEMLYDVEVSRLALAGALSTGLPVMLGYTCMWGDDGTTVETHAAHITPDGDRFTLEDALMPLLPSLPTDGRIIIAAMHSEFHVTDAALEVIRRVWDGPVAAYPNSGGYAVPHWQFDTVCTPEEFARTAARWAADSVEIIGGCCGLGPDHIQAAAAQLGRPRST